VAGALCRAAVAGAVLYACVRLALGSYALLIGAMASLHVSGSDGRLRCWWLKPSRAIGSRSAGRSRGRHGRW
jgi:hypothetical protein